jgi:hypothetical protein
MAQMCLEINGAGGDLETLSSAVFRHGVIAFRSTQATVNAGPVRVAVNGGSLCKSQRHH